MMMTIMMIMMGGWKDDAYGMSQIYFLKFSSKKVSLDKGANPKNHSKKNWLGNMIIRVKSICFNHVTNLEL